jgi:hypothetical protein
MDTRLPGMNHAPLYAHIHPTGWGNEEQRNTRGPAGRRTHLYAWPLLREGRWSRRAGRVAVHAPSRVPHARNAAPLADSHMGQEDKPRTFKEICAVARDTNTREIGRCFKFILKGLESAHGTIQNEMNQVCPVTSCHLATQPLSELPRPHSSPPHRCPMTARAQAGGPAPAVLFHSGTTQRHHPRRRAGGGAIPGSSRGAFFDTRYDYEARLCMRVVMWSPRIRDHVLTGLLYWQVASHSHKSQNSVAAAGIYLMTYTLPEEAKAEINLKAISQVCVVRSTVQR